MDSIQGGSNDSNRRSEAFIGVSEGLDSARGSDGIVRLRVPCGSSEPAKTGNSRGGRAGSARANERRDVASEAERERAEERSGVSRGGAVPAGGETFGLGSLGNLLRDLRLNSNGLNEPENRGESLTDGLKKAIITRIFRYDVRQIWSMYTSIDRLSFCGHVVGANKVQLLSNNGVWHYRGIARCASAWACIVCAAKIREYRAEQIKEAVLNAIGVKGWSCYMVTRTIQHNDGDNLSFLLKGLSACKRSLDANDNVKRVYKQFGRKGAITAKELTLGKNGWHPHTHEIVFFDHKLSLVEQVELQSLLIDEANKFYTRHGFGLLNGGEHKHPGIKLDYISKRAADAGEYLSKIDGGFNAHMELTRMDLKKARNGGRSPFAVMTDFYVVAKERYAIVKSNGVVSDSLQLACETDYNALIEYEDATRGMHVLHWTKGLKDALLQKWLDKTDEELVEIPVHGTLEATIEAWYFEALKRKNLDSRVLAALALRGLDGMITLLTELGVYDEDGLDFAPETRGMPDNLLEVKLKKEVQQELDSKIQAKDRKEVEQVLYDRYFYTVGWRIELDNVDKADALAKEKERLLEKEKEERARRAKLQANQGTLW